MRSRTLAASVLLAGGLLTFTVGIQLAGTAPDPGLPWWTFGSSGNSSTSTNFSLSSTAGQTSVVGTSSNGTTTLGSGFWYGMQDVDADGIALLFDNCPVDANPLQEDFDGDEMGDVCDPDDDNDLIGDIEETNCGADTLDAGSIPERIDGIFAGVDDDGNDGADEPLPAGAENFDCDGDGYIGTAEAHVYSYVPQADGDQQTCQEYDTSFSTLDPNQTAATPSLRWPSDFRTGSIPDSTNRINILDLASFVVPVRYFGTNVGTNPGDVRWDLAPGKGPLAVDINILDIAALAAPASATGSPPMLGGVRAFIGPVCPWPE